MAAFGSLLTGVTGLRANQSMLDVIGNNLANANTTGFKSQRVRFGDLFYQTVQPPTPSSQLAGGTDPIQVGFGAAMSSIDTISSQGTLQPTGRDLDMGIQGAGFFQVSDGTNVFFTRSGSFDVDSNGILRDPATGYYVERFGSVGDAGPTGPGFQVASDPRIRIPFGIGIPGQTTSNVSLVGNLDAAAAGATPGKATANVTLQGTLDSSAAVGATVPASIQVFDSQGAGHALSLTFTKTAADTWSVSPSVPASEGPVTGNPTTLGPLVFDANTGALTSSGNSSLTFDFSPSGASSSQPITFSLSGLSESNAASTATASGQDGVAAVPGGTASSAIQIFDSKGTGHVLSLTFKKIAANPSANPPTPASWSVAASVPASEGSVSGTLGPITFNSNGTPKSLGISSLIFDFSKSGASPGQTVTFSMGVLGGFTGLTEFGGNSTAAATNQDGFAPGTLTSVNVGKEGVINGVFSNGKVTPLAQLAVANFANADALTRQGNNLFTVNSQSGQALVGAGLTGGRGSVQQGVLEQSNVDVSNEFTQLIIAQRGFSVNARTVTVSDEVLQELTNIIR
jgi:flagellar hook protein FlgE